MSDRAPLPRIEGEIAPHVGEDFEILTLLADTALVAVSVTLVNAPTSGSAVVEIRNATSLLATVTIPQGQRSAAFTGSVAVTNGTPLKMRLTAAGGDSSVLSGSIGFGADVLLTSVERVKEHGGITATASDALILELVAAVSQAIEDYVGRPILLRTITNEVHRPSGDHEAILLNRFPVVGTPTVSVDGVALLAADFEIGADSGMLLRVSGGSPFAWAAAITTITYQAGYLTVPAAIRLAATKQARFELRQAKAGGDRLGESAQGFAAGGSTAFETDGLLASVRELLAPYREIRALGD